jgi:hypothetical protein
MGIEKLNNKTSQKRQCDYCKENHTWIWEGQLYKDGSKIYLDEKAKRWSGKRCPGCERKRVNSAIKYTSFAKTIVFKELTKNNFIIKSKKYPFTVEKNGKDYLVGIEFAHTYEGKIILEKNTSANSEVDIVALVFKNVRLLSKNKINSLECDFFSPKL